ncbi:hypothetical protein CR513_54349, partial [Mucuna pruriens]
MFKYLAYSYHFFNDLHVYIILFFMLSEEVKLLCFVSHSSSNYCMRVDEMSELTEKLEVCKDWACQECMAREGTNKIERHQVPLAHSVNEIVYSIPEKSSGETSFSGPSFCNIDAVESSGQLDHNDPNYPNEKKNESQKGEQPKKAATAMIIHKLCTDPASDERSHLRDLVQAEPAFLSQGVVIPEADCTWLGKFRIHGSEVIARTWDGIQAHLSNCASSKVHEVVDRLLEIIILEELPRLRISPSQFKGSQNDFALKGNLDGVELLIFPSNILPEKSHYFYIHFFICFFLATCSCLAGWNNVFLLWGVFRGRKVNNSASTPVSNSLKLENGDAVKSLPFNLNAYPEDGDNMAIIGEIPDFDGTGGLGCSGDRVLLVGENSNSKGGGANAEPVVIDVNISLWPESETPENGSVGIEDNNVKVPSTSLSLAPPSTIIDPIDWKVAIDLIIFSLSLKCGI